MPPPPICMHPYVPCPRRLVGAASLAKASLGNMVWSTLLLNGSCGLPLLQLKVRGLNVGKRGYLVASAVWLALFCWQPRILHRCCTLSAPTDSRICLSCLLAHEDRAWAFRSTTPTGPAVRSGRRCWLQQRRRPACSHEVVRPLGPRRARPEDHWQPSQGVLVRVQEQEQEQEQVQVLEQELELALDPGWLQPLPQVPQCLAFAGSLVYTRCNLGHCCLRVVSFTRAHGGPYVRSRLGTVKGLRKCFPLVLLLSGFLL